MIEIQITDNEKGITHSAWTPTEKIRLIESGDLEDFRPTVQRFLSQQFKSVGDDWTATLFIDGEVLGSISAKN